MRLRLPDLAPSEFFGTEISDFHGAADLRFRLDGTQFDVARLLLSIEGMNFEARGEAKLRDPEWAAMMEFSLDSATRDALLSLWPAHYAGEAKDWTSKRVETGTVFAVNGGLRLQPNAKPAANVNFQFEGIDLEFMEGYPPLKDAKGFGVFEGSSLGFRFDRGQVVDTSGNSVDIAGSELSIPNVFDDSAQAQLTLTAKSTASQLLALVEQPPLELLSASRIPSDVINGKFSGSATVGFPLRDAKFRDNISFQVKGDIHSAVAPGILGDGSFVSERPARGSRRNRNHRQRRGQFERDSGRRRVEARIRTNRHCRQPVDGNN